MAKDSYRKRLKGHWRQGKGYKGDSSERQHAKEEVRQFLREMDESYLERHRGKKKRNERARLEHRIDWCLLHLKDYELRGSGDGLSWWIRGTLWRSQNKYRERFGEDYPAPEVPSQERKGI